MCTMKENGWIDSLSFLWHFVVYTPSSNVDIFLLAETRVVTLHHWNLLATTVFINKCYKLSDCYVVEFYLLELSLTVIGEWRYYQHLHQLPPTLRYRDICYQKFYLQAEKSSKPKLVNLFQIPLYIGFIPILERYWYCTNIQ